MVWSAVCQRCGGTVVSIVSVCVCLCISCMCGANVWKKLTTQKKSVHDVRIISREALPLFLTSKAKNMKHIFYGLTPTFLIKDLFHPVRKCLEPLCALYDYGEWNAVHCRQVNDVHSRRVSFTLETIYVYYKVVFAKSRFWSGLSGLHFCNAYPIVIAKCYSSKRIDWVQFEHQRFCIWSRKRRRVSSS